MVFRLSNTFKEPAQGSNAQRGFPTPGAGNQTVGVYTPPPVQTPWESDRPTKGIRSWFKPAAPVSGQRGFPEAQNLAQHRPPNSMPNIPPTSGEAIEVWTPYYSRGTAAWVPNFGKVLYNPIGAGVVANHRTQASYGPAAQYIDGALWWTSQVTPTSIDMTGLTSPETLQAILGNTMVQAVVRVEK
jgi:hypothetical protein